MDWKRVAIVGTAQSWKKTPWNDPGLTILSLNDAYRMPGFQRADVWFDLHPLDKFLSVPAAQGAVYAHQVPPGHYVRPEGHLGWLAHQTIPVYLHPDYATQHPPAAEWAHVRPFPKAEIEAECGRYFTSSPGWMAALAVMQGVEELHVYGIHLATEHEYIEQRPNFEFLMGRVLGGGKLRVTEHDGMRRYETPNGCVVLPEASPILASDFQYAFEPRPASKLEPYRWALHKAQVKRERAIQALRVKPWWHPAKPLQTELTRLDALVADRQEQLQRVSAPVRG
jgi:hypothetical protein